MRLRSLEISTARVRNQQAWKVVPHYVSNSSLFFLRVRVREGRLQMQK